MNLLEELYKQTKYLTDEQLRAFITSYCLTNNIAVDTKQWDDLIANIFDNYYCGSIDSLDLFDFYMGDLLC